MPVLDSDIAAAIRPAAVATWSDAAIAGRYPSARDGSGEPATGYFDAIADAQTCINARGALIGVDGRRRFMVAIDDLVWIDPSLGLPTHRFVDSEQAVDASMLLSRIAVNLEDERTTEELFG